MMLLRLRINSACGELELDTEDDHWRMRQGEEKEESDLSTLMLLRTVSSSPEYLDRYV